MTDCGYRNLAGALLEGWGGGLLHRLKVVCANPPSHVPRGHGVARTLLSTDLRLCTSMLVCLLSRIAPCTCREKGPTHADRRLELSKNAAKVEVRWMDGWMDAQDRPCTD